MCTKKKFLEDPLKWYNEFWFPFFPHKYTNCKPNEGHEVLSEICASFPKTTTIITQNIDGLHHCTTKKYDHENQLIEIHGKLGLYHCSRENEEEDIKKLHSQNIVHNAPESNNSEEESLLKTDRIGNNTIILSKWTRNR